MVRRLINVFTNCGADEISIIINSISELTFSYLRKMMNTVNVQGRRILLYDKLILQRQRGWSYRGTS